MQFQDLLPRDINLNFTSVPKTIGNLKGATLSCTIAALKQKNQGPLLVVCQDSSEARNLQDELHALLPKIKIKIFSDYETLPYDRLSPHQDLISERLKILSSINSLQDGIIISPLMAILSRLSPIEFIKQRSFCLSTSDNIDLNSTKKELVEHGYLLVQQVLEHGEFAIRGSILDIYPMGAKLPYRIDFLDDEVDSIRTFDVDSQRSLDKVDKISLLPAHEFPLDEDGISVFRSNYRNTFVGANLKNHVIYQAISKGAVPAGIEYYLPLFFSHTNTIFDYLNDKFNIVLLNNIEDNARIFFEDAQNRALSLQGNPDHPALLASELFLINL